MKNLALPQSTVNYQLFTCFFLFSFPPFCCYLFHNLYFLKIYLHHSHLKLHTPSQANIKNFRPPSILIFFFSYSLMRSGSKSQISASSSSLVLAAIRALIKASDSLLKFSTTI